MTVQEVNERLRSSGLKVTPQRSVIYSMLFRARNHPTAEQVFDLIHESHPSISLATVYKTMETLEKNGLLVKVKTAGDRTRYDANTDHHNHIYCTKTNRIIDYEDNQLKQMLQEYFREKGIENFKVNDIRLQINGEIIDARKGITF
ncbi:MAG: Fur family transcriptional regulator [Bacteroidia bacterium]